MVPVPVVAAVSVAELFTQIVAAGVVVIVGRAPRVAVAIPAAPLVAPFGGKLLSIKQEFAPES